MEALKAGKHVMCTVPMATTIADCEKICQLVADTGLKYMMAETVVYSREFLFIKELYQKGELGEIQYMQASHPQDMDGWPDYWERMIPMHYATHVVSPVLGWSTAGPSTSPASARARCATTSARSRATRSPSSRATSRSPRATSRAHIWRFLYDTARQYRESFDVYGTKKSFEWSLVEGEPHVLHTAKKPEPEIAEKVEVPDYAHLLPAEIQQVHPFDRRRRPPVVPARGRSRRLASSSGQRVRPGAGRRPRSLAERGDQRQLDLRRHSGPRIGPGRRRDQAVARVHSHAIVHRRPPALPAGVPTFALELREQAQALQGTSSMTKLSARSARSCRRPFATSLRFALTKGTITTSS